MQKFKGPGTPCCCPLVQARQGLLGQLCGVMQQRRRRTPQPNPRARRLQPKHRHIPPAQVLVPVRPLHLALVLVPVRPLHHRINPSTINFSPKIISSTLRFLGECSKMIDSPPPLCCSTLRRLALALSSKRSKSGELWREA